MTERQQAVFEAASKALRKEFPNFHVAVQAREDGGTAISTVYGGEPETVLGLLALSFDQVKRDMS